MENNTPFVQPPESPRSKNPLEKLKALLGKTKILSPKIVQVIKEKMAFVIKLWNEKHEVPPSPFKPEGKSGLIAKIRVLILAHRGKLIIGGGVLVCLLIVRGCFFNPKTKKSLEQVVSEPTEAKDKPVPVKGFKVGRFNYEDSLNALGTVKGAMEFKLSFEIPGVISSVNYKEGERYEEGSLLISLRQDDILLRLKRSQADLNKSQTNAQIAEDKVKEHEKLFAMGAIPKSTLDKVKLELDATKYEAEAARLETKANEAMLEKSNLYAPSAGMIGNLNVEEGETVTPNTLVGTHVNTEFVYAEFGVVERDVNKIALGQKARVFIDAFPDKNFEGVIENISPVVAGTSRTATARVRVENPEHILLPGMFARIRILLYSKKNTLIVPTESVQGGEGEQFIYVVNPQKNVTEKRTIAIGYTRPDYSQVDAGLTEGEIVAVSGLEKLEEGKTVRLLETQEAEI
ncbi:MAG: efflux RND transporter periplasmic adaptor subunit [Candidatus Omnitrophica bacterium]|nr:efflux RND transporter periplasmic adaptor subunit [Candidatus Omnitrophota bacterium]